jgi:CheY-like chemotaxis protein
MNREDFMSPIIFHGSQESVNHIADRIRHHRLRRDPNLKTKNNAPLALIVDDDVESVQPLQIVLRNFGFETMIAFDGKEAFEAMSTKHFDIVFLDICMPEMTGLEMLQQVESFQEHDRKHSLREHPLPIVTYSAHHIGEYEIPDGEKFFFAAHWQKPVSLAELATLTGHTINELGILKRA